MNNWIETNNTLTKTFTFPSFKDAVTWMATCSDAIDRLNHHPEWTNVYNKVHVSLCTHDANHTITKLDYELADLLDSLYENNFPAPNP